VIKEVLHGELEMEKIESFFTIDRLSMMWNCVLLQKEVICEGG